MPTVVFRLWSTVFSVIAQMILLTNHTTGGTPVLRGLTLQRANLRESVRQRQYEHILERERHMSVYVWNTRMMYIPTSRVYIPSIDRVAWIYDWLAGAWLVKEPFSTIRAATKSTAHNGVQTNVVPNEHHTAYTKDNKNNNACRWEYAA